MSRTVIELSNFKLRIRTASDVDEAVESVKEVLTRILEDHLPGTKVSLDYTTEILVFPTPLKGESETT